MYTAESSADVSFHSIQNSQGKKHDCYLTITTEKKTQRVANSYLILRSSELFWGFKL